MQNLADYINIVSPPTYLIEYSFFREPELTKYKFGW